MTRSFASNAGQASQRQARRDTDAEDHVRVEAIQEFGVRLRELRKSRGWSAERFAHECSLTMWTVSRIERGRQEPRLGTLFVLMRALSVSSSELIFLLRGEAPQ
jgi:XRE family transcriptional regulator, regulator of sulfur utilization